MIRITQMLIFFGTICSISVMGIASSTEENLSQTSQCVQPINYTIFLKPQNTTLFVNSTVVLNVSCKQPHIKLYVQRDCHMQINVQTDIQYKFFSRWKFTRMIHTYSSTQRFDILTISLFKENRTNLYLERRNMTLQPGFYKINSIYNCTLKEVATVLTTYRNQNETKEVLVLPRIPSEWIFPYWKNPAIKSRFTIHIEHKNTVTAVSNMPVKYKYSKPNIIRTGFDNTPAISTHLVALFVIPNVYPTNNLTRDTVTITSSSKMKNATLYAQMSIFNVTKILKNMLNDIIPQSYVHYALLPIVSTHYESRSIITTGLVLISEAHSIYNPKVDSIIQKREVTCLIVRSVIQELFSNWIAIFRQSDSWFLEGFSTVFGIYIHDQSLETTLLESIVVQTRRSFLDYTEAFNNYDFPLQNNSIIVRNSTFRKMWRDKAFSTFYMLSGVFQHDFLYISMFKEIVKLYYNTNNTSNNTYDNLSILDKLWTTYENFETHSVYKSPYMKSSDIKSMISSWTAQSGYPVVQVNRHNDTQSVSAMIIDCFDVDSNDKMLCKQKWWIPVTFKTIFNTQVLDTFHHVLKPDGKLFFTSVFLKNHITLVVNCSGYRVNYDRESWKRIAFFLKNTDPKIVDLSDVTLAQLLDDAFYFLVQNTEYNKTFAPYNIDLDIYFELASSIFHGNNSYTAWYPVFIALENMSRMFLFPESVLSRNIKIKLLKMLNKFLDSMSNIHKNNVNNVNTQFYHEGLKWICILDDLKCKEHINRILSWQLTTNKLLPSWQKWIYCQGLLLKPLDYEDFALWHIILNIYRTQGKLEEFFELLTCFKQYDDLVFFLRFLDSNSLLSTIGNKKKSVAVSILFNIFASYSKTSFALTNILFAVENNIIRNVNILAIINCIINNIYSNHGLSLITDEMFLNTLLHIHQLKPFVLDAIRKKAKYRRTFLDTMQNILRLNPQYMFNYKHTSK
ncbi:aminopeptidase N-like isoform X2 [Pseudomyrmex gracilis]|uniref:aminopeptidase N-like isoform X2 n=1 Tax=Pseudomyrmex gracilis TaxID=219809 RepID=UPI000995A141|nr:aminopeptidase N-like isoform X2 [Pseudomyrmex gracilis]